MAQSSDRLTITLFLAGAFHLIVILGVTFAAPAADRSVVPTLEVLLVNNALPESARNDEASYLAERTQQGSGNSTSDRTRQPGSGNAPEDATGEAEGRPVQSLPAGAAGGEGEILAGRDGRPRFIAREADANASPVARRQSLAGQPSPFAGDQDAAELELKGSERPELLVTPSTRTSDVAVYLDAWKRRIEQVGTLNFPNEARRRRLSGNPVIEVVLASNGGLVRAVVRRTSGHGELDRAAMDILKLATPFEAFPAELAARHDVVRFAYEWQFVGGRLAGSTVELPAPSP
ncbi:MAG: energy transducer TonB [Steroidobacteraceae bacterium]